MEKSVKIKIKFIKSEEHIYLQFPKIVSDVQRKNVK